MKKLFATAVAALLGASSAQADIFGMSNFKTDGSLEVLGQQADNEVDFSGAANDHRGNTITRIRLGANMDVTEGITGRLELVRNSNGGTAVQYGDAARPTNLNTEQTLIQIQNASLDIDGFLHTDLFRIGRQYGGRKGDLLLYYGPRNDDAMSVTAFDSVLAKKKFGKVDALFATGKVVEDDAVPGSAASTDQGDTVGDVNVSYLIFSSDELIPSRTVPLELGYYRIDAANAAATGDNQRLLIYDLRGKYAFMDDALTVGLEYAMNGGQDNAGSSTGTRGKFKGTAYVLSGDYHNEDNRLGLKGFFANASGADQNATNFSADKSFHDGGFLGGTASDFRYGEILSNSNTLAAVRPTVGVGLDTGTRGRGLRVIGLGASYVPTFMDDKLAFTADLFSVKVNKVVNGGDKGVGEELDLAVRYFYSDAVTASLGYAMLMTDTGLASDFAANPVNVRTDNVTKVFAKLKIKWGGEPEASAPVRSTKPAAKPYQAPAAKPAPRRR